VVTLADLVAHQAGKPVAVIKHFRMSGRRKKTRSGEVAA